MKQPMFETLLELPMFQGMKRTDITSIVERIKVEFSKPLEGKTFIEQGSLCSGLVFLLRGDATIVTQSPNNAYTLTELISAPEVLEPEVIFGMSTRYTRSYAAMDNTHLMIFSKQSITSILLKSEIFQFNILNYISTVAQRTKRLLVRPQYGSIEQRIVQFIHRHSVKPAGEKKLAIKMDALAVELGETRINVSKALNQMQDKELIQLRRKEIYIPAFEKLLGAY